MEKRNEDMDREENRRLDTPAGAIRLAATAAAAIAMATLAGVLVVAGCGEKSGSDQASSSGQTIEQTAAVPAAATPVLPAAGQTQAQQDPQAATLPPDISVTIPDTLVTPGSAIEFAVEGTPDVAQIALSDGINDTQAFVRDAEGTWRVGYRVPLKPKQERIGLSITAKNEAGRWRRVWVFLHVQKPVQEQIEAKVDSTSEAK